MEKKKKCSYKGQEIAALALSNLIISCKMLNGSEIMSYASDWEMNALNNIEDGIARLAMGFTGEPEFGLGNVMAEYANNIIQNIDGAPNTHKMATDAVRRFQIELMKEEEKTMHFL